LITNFRELARVEISEGVKRIKTLGREYIFQGYTLYQIYLGLEGFMKVAGPRAGLERAGHGPLHRCPKTLLKLLIALFLQ
jgi:hypothetical protein